MTLEELEGVIWRQLPRDTDAETVETILAAAQSYAATETGLLTPDERRRLLGYAERRRISADATGLVVTHMMRGGPGATVPACGRAGRGGYFAGTHDPVKVTCAACRRTSAYQQALAEAS